MLFISRKIQEKSLPFLKENSNKNTKSRVFFGPEIIKYSQSKSLFSRGLFIWLVLLIIILLYLLLAIINLLSPPEIIIYFPPDKLVTKERIITIKGKIKGSGGVMINNQPVTLKENIFEEKISLLPGINVIKISSQKKIGKETTIFRQVIVE